MCAIITPAFIVSGHVGDSRSLVGSTSTVTSLTEDHKPDMEDEKNRIEKAGGFVMMGRVVGELAMSRALGDFRYKSKPNLPDHEQMVICYPDVAVYKRTPSADRVLVLACDGVWDVMDESEAVSHVCDEMNFCAADAAEALVHTALAKGSTDNISAIVVKL